ncbi:uncharacterized protein LOC123546793 [Mercenaria mercenaria]|uniref:uncharacterized protein LOC123546793 n=1 Tax=Mercenaria mercenaria TaxID=6596 RepID=UPI00234E8874|nr:uncharacterized protein LOC123546793 [Mercenaria mercenaria]
MHLGFLLLIALVRGVHTFYLEDGYDHHYTYSSRSDILGMHNITTIIKVRVRAVNTSEEGSLYQLFIDSFVQHSEKGYVADNPLKWDLSRTFLFTSLHAGLVTFVHFHPDEIEELVTLKKVLASTLSARVAIGNGNTWSLSSLEEDHAGTFHREYRGERHSDGIRLIRSHTSLTDVHRHHNKTLHYDLKGTPLHIESLDNVTLRHTPSTIKTNIDATINDIKDSQDGEFPTISSVSRNKMKLTLKRKHSENGHGRLPSFETDTISVKKKPVTKKLKLNQVEGQIQSLISAVHNISDKFDTKRTEKVHELRNLVESLRSEDFLELGKNVFTHTCDTEDILCVEERYLLLDIIAQEGSKGAQKIVLDLIMKRPNVTEEEMRRCLFHTIPITDPIPELVAFVEDLCISDDSRPGETPTLSATRKRACLSLGAIAKSLHNKNVTESDRIVGRIETWLNIHNEKKASKIIKPRMKRYVVETDEPAHYHIETKTVLIQSLGNAGKQRSLRHIMSYMEPNVGVTAWRRAAINSLRHFKCQKSADLLVTSATYDNDFMVRKTARQVLEKHPQGTKFTAEQEQTVLSKSYTYPVVVRVKRGALQTLQELEQGIYFHVEPPGIDWDKTIGTKDIGASFGLHIRNVLDLRLGILEGHFALDLHDEAYATAHVGLLNLHVNIVRARVCFKGHVRYNLNVLKEFGIDSVQDVVKIYDRVIENIVEPIKTAVQRFIHLITLFKDGTMMELVGKFINVIKDLPNILGDITKRIEEFVKDVYNIAINTVMEEVKLIINEVRHFFDDIKTSLLHFYNEIVDAVTMGFPFIANKIKQSFELIVEAMKQLFNNPMQAITTVARAITNVKMAVTMFVDVKTRVVEACMFLKGRVMYWVDTAKKLPDFFRRLKDSFTKLLDSVRNRRDLVDDMDSAFSNGVDKMKSSAKDLINDLKAKWDAIYKRLQPLLDIVQPFYDVFKSIMDLIKGVKTAYTEVKTVIVDGKARIQRVFGPKFDKKFPVDRRYNDTKNNCSAGVYPTTTDNFYDTTGVDIIHGVGQSIVNPVNGIVKDFGPQKVLIQPVDPEFQQFEIIIENINPFVYVFDQYIKSGKKIGRASKAPKCKPNFIHVSVRKKRNDTDVVDDADYEYVDPSPFLDRLIPYPKWFKECNDHEFRYLEQTFDSGESTQKLDPDEVKEAVKRYLKDGLSNGTDGIFDPIGPFEPGEDLEDKTSFKDSLKESLKEQTKKFTAFFKTALFGKDGPVVPNIMAIINLNSKPVDWLVDHLDNQSRVYTEFNDVITLLGAKMKEAPDGDPETMSLHHISGTLGNHGISVGSSSVSQTKDKLLTIAEQLCPIFKGAIAIGFGHVCNVEDNCLGISCSVALRSGSKKRHIKLGVWVKPSEKRIDLMVNNQNLTIKPDGLEAEVDLKIKLFGMKLYLGTHSEIKHGSFHLTVEAKLCIPAFSTCLPPIEIFNGIRFKLPNTGNMTAELTDSSNETNVISVIHQLKLPKLIQYLGEYGLLNKNVTGIINHVRGSVVKELLKDTVEGIGEVIQEFKDKVDFCVSANIPVPHKNIKIIPEVSYPFMVGPVPLTLEFGASGAIGLKVKVGLCIMSMKTQLQLTPWVAAKVWGKIMVNIGFAKGGLELVGYLMKTKFPLQSELGFSKFPLEIGAKMDLELTPLELKLKAKAEVFLILKWATVFEANIWRYKTPSISFNIFDKRKQEEDKSKPELMPSTINKRERREGVRGCIVEQIPGRPYYDTAFRLELYAQDEKSMVKLFYTVGTHAGGTNVVDWTGMGGSSLLVPTKLPGGVPLYWTVKARNSQGLEAVSQCFLDTFDNTLPDGRVEHAYTFSSHPNKLVASVIAFEDSLLVETHYKAVGYSPGQFGSQFVDWQELYLDHSSVRPDVSGPLKHFTVPCDGKLVAWILYSEKTSSSDICAQKCIDYGTNCVSFDYEHHSETCDLHDVVEGANAYLRISGTYSHFERLGSGFHTSIEYQGLPLKHGTVYFVNTKVTNILGYTAYLTGEGTMIDFTPPEPGHINMPLNDLLQADNCTAAITQRCVDVTWKENHRLITDGPGSRTVFNGHEPLYDELYTLTNHYISANWDGFHDDESGIWGYTWSVGRHVCGTDVVPFENPYAHLTDKKFWTDSAFHKGIHLPDGAYYVTVQALNGAELGGSLVTTVCHSSPFIVDTTPPVFNGVADIIYDEDFDLIAVYYNATDSLSKIAGAEFGLGKTKYDVQLKSYSQHAAMERDDPFVSVEELGLKEGIPAWLRVRVTNNVGLFTAGHGDEPILIDKSPPVPGRVLDGKFMRVDRAYQAKDNELCAQWVDFYDQESGIDRFLWGAGTAPGKDDVVNFHNLTRYDKSGCSSVKLQHNHSYFSTVFAYNNALNSKAANATSDGVLIDTTFPIAGHVQDGRDDKNDLKYSSETVSKSANWNGFLDPESSIDKYRVDVRINNEYKATFDVGKETEFEDETISMEHNDRVYFQVHGVNGASLESTSESDGFTVDLTPPILKELSDSQDGNSFQSNNQQMHLAWDYKDEESGIKEYQTVIFETRYGVKRKIWPSDREYNKSVPLSISSTRMSMTLGQLTLVNGAKYSLHVVTLNHALLASSHESRGVLVDTTPPNILKVKIGLPNDQEEYYDSNTVYHDDQNAIRVSWLARDSESGINKVFVAVGTEDDLESVQSYIDFRQENTGFIQHIHLNSYLENKTLYVVTVKAVNMAGLSQNKSKRIYVQKASVPGIVFDGRNLYEDEMYTTDYTSIAASFYGFESESCDITSYEWAIGTSAYGTDILSYTNYGLVMNNNTYGQCQIHIELFEDTTYYITVKAVTGCRDQFILSSSDGITLDRNPPEILYTKDQLNNDTLVVLEQEVLYQDTVDTLPIISNASDSNQLSSVKWALGSLPLFYDQHAFTDDFTSLTSAIALLPGHTTYITTNASDKAGNVNISSSFPVIPDKTAPSLIDLVCSEYLSVRQSMLRCTWKSVNEIESRIDKIHVSLSSNGTSYDILENYVIPKGFSQFNRDLFNYLNNTVPTKSSVLVSIVVTNVVGYQKTYGRQIIVDRTVPATEGLDVVTRIGTRNITDHQKCQIPRAYLELRMHGVSDLESDIDFERLEASVGHRPYGTDILHYTAVRPDNQGILFLDGFSLYEGEVFYATLRVYNKAGLKTEVTSDIVVVSQSPILEVTDGGLESDIDYQSVPNIIQGYWKYSDLCPIKEAAWSVHDFSGKVIFDFQPIPSAGQKLYNDEVSLENGMKYVIIVKTLDFLDRVRIARSDGVTVRIQPPLSGNVRDGLHGNLNYQFSFTELSANWDSFGDDSNDPTQSIDHYEVAIGNDRRYSKTRSNIHFFVNVGLNKSYTFYNLNLTAKLVKYYITVRSYSIAGGYTEGYSNGIRVGFNDEIIPGTVAVKSFQSSVNFVEASWTGFDSDIDIIKYEIGISNHGDFLSNDTLRCELFYINSSTFDVKNLQGIGLNEYVKVGNLNLVHGQTVYVHVLAKNEAGMCTAVTSSGILVDTTPATKGTIVINGIQSDTVLYANSDSEMHIKWFDVEDLESGILQIKVVLYECLSCNTTDINNAGCFVVADHVVQNDNITSFYDLQLDTQNIYVVALEIMNGAQLVTNVKSVNILVDTSSPLSGLVKITKDWYSMKSFQSSKTTLKGLLAIASSSDEYTCPTQTRFFPSNSFIDWTSFSKNFSTDFLTINRTGAFLGIGYNADLSEVIKSSIVSTPMQVQRGNYTFASRAAKGDNIITTFAFMTNYVAMPFKIKNKPVENEFDDSIFENITGFKESNNSEPDALKNSTLQSDYDISVLANGSVVSTGDQWQYIEENEYGFGINLLGYKITNNRHWYHVFWARNKFTSIQRWFQLPFDPTVQIHKYSILVDKRAEFDDSILDLALIIDDEEIANIAGFQFNDNMRIAALNWNEDGYKPPVNDIYHPFYAEAVVKYIDIPDTRDKPCRHGRGFYDEESGIKDIWLGVSDSKNIQGNIVPVSMYKSFCYPCRKPCEHLCNQPCNKTRLSGGFDLIPLTKSALNLKAARINNICLNEASETTCNSSAYYLNVKIVDFAGQETVAYSNAVQVDSTAPECDYVKCLDPDYSKDEPTEHLGSSSSIGAYWNCSEDVSRIESYKVRVFLTKTGEIVMKSKDAGRKSKQWFNLANGTFEDNKDYTVEVTAINSAGLTVNETCSVHVNLHPPDVSGSSTKPLYTEAVSDESDEGNIYWTSSQTSMGIQWHGGSADTEFYEWSVGTSIGKTDVLPPSMSGVNSTGSSAIVNGKLVFNSKLVNRTVIEYKDKTNMSIEEIQNLTNLNEKEKTFFQLEPGRCFHQSLYAIGYSHLKSKMQQRTVCIKRKHDIFLNETTRRVIASKSKYTNSWSKKMLKSSDIVVDALLEAGGISLGTLTDDDKSSIYGSAASADYRPFISNPDTTLDRTSRALRNRIQRSCNLSFYLAPSPKVTYTQINITVKPTTPCNKDDEFQPALVYWDNDHENWKHIDEGCREYLTAVMMNGTYVSQVCGDASDSNVTKRDVSSSLDRPRAFEVVRISRSFHNSRPSIVTSSVTLIEDAFVKVNLDATDQENDTLLYEILQQPENLNCSVSESGTLNCSFDENYYGTSSMKIRVTESDPNFPTYEERLFNEKTIRITVLGMPDKTDRFYIDDNGSFHADKRPSMKHIIKVEANRSSTVSGGKILLADVDGGEIFTEFPRMRSLANSTYKLKHVDAAEIPIENYTTVTYRTLKAYDIEFEFTPKVHGNMTFDFIAQNDDKSYTPALTIDVFVLANPCVYGHCSHVILGETGCDDIARAKSFSGFVCACDLGYKGQWCQTEINECAGEPCALMFDCEDMINNYKCNINIPKLMAILICSIIAVGGAVFLGVKLVNRYRVNKVGQSNVSLMEEKIKKTYMADSDPHERPLSSGSILLEPASGSAPPPSTLAETTNMWSNPNWFRPESVRLDSSLSTLTRNASQLLPPHHRSFKSMNSISAKTNAQTAVHDKPVDSEITAEPNRMTAPPSSFDKLVLALHKEGSSKITDIDV